MQTVGQLLTKSSGGLATVDPSASVLDALRLMAERNIGAVLVVEGRDLMGIFTERHYARKVILEGRSSVDTAVRDVMSTELYTVEPSQSVDECMALMTDRFVRHLPVVGDGQLIGIVSIGDLVKSTIAEQEQTIDELTRYIGA
ncbi:CBS domain-containing protein [Granulosicoccus antarcticus]|uniref:Hypoxic response protein 1 n=1 Tax=Granulosicoccus antarcticus IMCC3135 TaxID=1192854 RepID=A0A2Z2NWM9_9GAMM|nr:CBS domain-containing protein [Granulosicoccus antarcticus]ASJ75842.1 Hypoxic response protein 1 [Granulosicoccus antarcticus IMCC3135]